MTRYITHVTKGGKYELIGSGVFGRDLKDRSDLLFIGTAAGAGHSRGINLNVCEQRPGELFFYPSTHADVQEARKLPINLYFYRDVEKGTLYFRQPAEMFKMVAWKPEPKKELKDFTFSLIAAKASDRAIGYNNGLPWPKSDIDMQWFVEHTKGKVVVMGRKTWESIGSKPLPGRINIVLTSKPITAPAGGFLTPVYPFKTIHEIFEWLQGDQEPIELNGRIYTVTNEIMIMGGAKVYESFAPYIRKLYISTFTGKWAADTYLHINLEGCQQVYSDKRRSDVHFEIYQKPAFIVAGYDFRYSPD